MSWNNRENNSQNPNDTTPIIDRCINCGNHEQVHAQITMEYEGSLNTGPICRMCYSTHKGLRINRAIYQLLNQRFLLKLCDNLLDYND